MSEKKSSESVLKGSPNFVCTGAILSLTELLAYNAKEPAHFFSHAVLASSKSDPQSYAQKMALKVWTPFIFSH